MRDKDSMYGQAAWPDYPNDQDNAMHAVGCITSWWARVENVYERFLYQGLEYSQAAFLRTTLTNSQKIGLIRASTVILRRTEPAMSEAIGTFLLYANICAENRNFIAHADIQSDAKLGAMRVSKRANQFGGKDYVFHVNVADLRRMAQEMADVALYGSIIPLAMRTPVPLPPIPPKPRKWDQLLPKEDRKSVPRPPEASEA
ncbi:MAG: hypothetical protein EOS58_06720 [Mesorhizobium sp.]|uniref:hypothetical protein n=2 Tax=unclassified Mesorhizobium TaxID=325217 RepID=UPI000FC9E118|nr:hypothetical protein [Mesorhizobium sp.]RWC11054.1 MAG: hypothetical protein EOS53_28050 [Mesorhizobium sp.]RWD06693.1 MAG: hypothetical protein EOS58_06720 [Mesorhizobium sp.]RWD26535.1 MAG: hypothetical protein EOS33_20715 [Mesorhizobium sp.]RWD26831.1 MAG: hypothetical protein EOS22_15040 [Mesorhizobium sp.]TIW27642.1 MAG: hypothetical protein E5V63_08855 [Mesorhizobium sp.]